MAVPTGFEPAFSALTGPRVWPGYTTGPTAEDSTAGGGRRGRARHRPGPGARPPALLLCLQLIGVLGSSAEVRSFPEAAGLVTWAHRATFNLPAPATGAVTNSGDEHATSGGVPVSTGTPPGRVDPGFAHYGYNPTPPPGGGYPPPGSYPPPPPQPPAPPGYRRPAPMFRGGVPPPRVP